MVIVASVPGYASKCTISNVEILSDLIDKRINATVTARVAELTAAIAKDRLNATVNETIAETVSTAVSSLHTFSLPYYDLLMLARSALSQPCLQYHECRQL